MAITPSARRSASPWTTGSASTPWNTAYASDAYRDVLRKVEASGQPRTVIFHLWYPAEADRSGDRLAGPRSPWPAVSGERAKMEDFFFNDEQFALPVLRSSVLFPATHERLHFKGGGTLAELSGGAGQEAFETIGKHYFAAPRGAYLDAPPASAPPRRWGDFPSSSCPTGSSAATTACGAISARFLASHGYVVAAPSFISDSGVPLVFHDPDSVFARAVPAGEVREAYELIMGEQKVIPNFFRFMSAPRPPAPQSGADESRSGRRAARHHDDAEPVSPARGRRGVADPHGEAAGRGRSRLRGGAELDGRDLGRARAVRPALPVGSAARSDWPAIPSAR